MAKVNIKNPNPKNDWNVGDLCWFVTPYQEPSPGRIIGIESKGPAKAPAIHVRGISVWINDAVGPNTLFQTVDDAVSAGTDSPVQNFGHAYVTTILDTDRLFASLPDVLTAIHESNRAKQLNYEKEIKDVNDLIRFALNHPIAPGDDLDNEARAAYIKRAYELLNIDSPF